MNMQSFTKAKLNLVLFTVLSLISFASFAADNSALNVFTSSATANGGQNYSLSLQTLILLTALSFLPTIVLMMTSFTRIIIVLSLLRQAIGAQSSPPNQILLGLALFLTFFIMSPVLDRVYSEAYKPLSENKITMQQALDKGSVPIREFMLKQTREADLAMFLNLAGKKVANPNEIPMSVLIPSFMTSELKTGFQIGFSIFIPFLVIDMVVASVLMAMGMMMLPPSIVSLPFKLMLFVLVDGWQLLIGSLANSFR
jgi:flagellar biosynthetic protein FliP